MDRPRPIHRSGYDREAHDYYATPAWVTACLLRHVSLRGAVWEPCCGDGAIAAVLESHQHAVVASDLEDRGVGTPGVDFFGCSGFPLGCGAMVTNPPYGDGGASRRATNASIGMLRFVRHALALTRAADGQLALLVRFQWTAGQRAAALLQEGMLDRVLVLTRRIQWFDRGMHTTTGQHHHAWVIFDAQRDRSQPSSIVFDQ